jgi:1,5-anhydro-D-fructose reductase (1,5-anhydro-D-mannitol-forming)
MRLRTAIIGYGRMGEIRRSAMERHGGYEVVAACDVDIGREIGIPLYRESHDVYQHKPDVIVCAVPNLFIPTIVCDALDRGCHVFSEKPPGRHTGDVQLMANAAASNPGKVLKFGFNHRFHDAVEEAHRIISSGALGELYFMRGVYGKAGGMNYAANWRNDPELSGGGILIDQGIHMLDLLLMFAGKFSDVKSVVQRKFWTEANVEDNAFALMTTSNGVVATLHSSATQWRHTFKFELYLRNGFVSIDGILSASGSYGTEVLQVALNRFAVDGSPLPNPECQEIRFTQDRSWDKEMSEFYDGVVNGKLIEKGTIQQAYDVMSLVEQIYRSDKHWQQREMGTTISRLVK